MFWSNGMGAIGWLVMILNLLALWALGSLTFGYHNEARPENWSAVSPGRVRWGAYDDVGGLLMTAVDREQGHWFGGRLVPASGVAGAPSIFWSGPMSLWTPDLAPSMTRSPIRQWSATPTWPASTT